MSRRVTIIVAAVMGLGCIVAMLPAQESSRRTASKYRSDASGAPGTTAVGTRPNLSPPAGDPELGTVNPARGKSEFGTGVTQELIAPPPSSPPSRFPGGGFQPLDAGAASESAPVADGDGGRMRSILKRAEPSATEERAPTTSLPEANSPATGSSGGSAFGTSVFGNNSPSATAPAPPATLSSELLRRVENGPSGNSSFTNTSANPSNQTKAAVASKPGQLVTASNKSAALRVEIQGPHGVTVGKPAAYTVSLSNESDSLAEDVQVRLNLPSWVTLQAVQPTNGETAAQNDSQGGGRLVWNLPRVVGRAREQLKLQIVTGESDGFDLSAEWTAKAVGTRASIIVKQAQIALALAGPADMTFGEEKTFTLTVSNPGTGDAERVIVSVASGSAPAQQFDAGMIPAGHKKEVPLAVVASQTGSIDLLISAATDGGVDTRTSHKITVRKAEVNVAIEGPPIKFAGSEAIYTVAVKNSGTAAADNVNLSLQLPVGARYLSGIDGGSSAGSAVKWRIASLAPGAQREYEVRVHLGAAGLNRFEIQSQAAASGTSNCVAETDVEAVSDLKLVVNDPSGPTAIGEQAVYELQLVNRGSQAARQVKIVMQFSDGVEPVSFEGCDARLVPGQVLCQPLPQLGPGEQATMKIKAQAHQAGAHHYRIEVTTQDGEARLVSEGTTRFFADGGRGAAASTARRAGTTIPTTTR
jgi:uncharacterized repeat protein (TIGR01451 family)